MNALASRLVYVSRRLTDGAMAALESLPAEMRLGADAPPTRQELLEGISGADAAIVTLTERIDADVLRAAGPQLKIVANVAVGYDNIDLAALTAAGVTVSNTPGVLDQATADHTFALILAVTRRVGEGDRFIRSRRPWVWGPRMLVGLDVSAGATLGILGYGRIGSALARRAAAFGMTVVATTRRRQSGTDEAGVRFVDTDTMLGSSDVVSVLTPFTPQTRHLIDAAAIASMKQGSYLINTARGGVVDEKALVAALHGGHLAGAALDVFENEPDVDPMLYDAPNLIMTPHIASAGEATRDAMGLLAIDNVAAVLAGRSAVTAVHE